MADGGLAAQVGPGWADVLAPVAATISGIGDHLRAEVAAGRGFLPGGSEVFAALRTPFDDVRVLLLGQDPYPTPGHAMGLCFSVRPDVRPLPKSLVNVFAELRDDLGVAPPGTGDLRGWAEQGVLLLNRTLTVRPGVPGSHRGIGWEQVTEHVIRAVAARDAPLVAILWGRDARDTRPLLAGAPAVESPHPSPLSAHRGFLGSRPFSRTNAHLEQLGAAPVDWARTAASRARVATA